MNTEDLRDLRIKAGLTQSKLSKSLDISSRTLAGWEAGPLKDLTKPEARAVSSLLQPILLGPKIKEMGEQAFEAIPSELVSVWVVDNDECFVIPETSRWHYAEDKKKYIYIPRTVCRLVEESLTTYPLRTTEILNLAGEAILNHRAKKNKSNRASYLFKDGLCESLLHVPAFCPSAWGPRPVLLLSLENKLGKNRENVIKSEDGVMQIYTDTNTTTAKALAEQFKELLLEDMKLLGMINLF